MIVKNGGISGKTGTFARVMASRLGDQVYGHLIEAIATNTLPEGAKIQEEDLAEQMGVSKTPIREALRRLEAEGFVVANSHRTPEVRRLDRVDVVELYSIREYLERLAIRATTELADPKILSALEELQRKAEEDLASGRWADIGQSVAYNQKFHHLILKGAMNQRLQRTYGLIDVDIRRLAYRSIRVAGRQREAVTQHRTILEAIKNREVDLAETLITQHILTAKQDVLHEIDSSETRDAGVR